ncbi:hypothetical protein P4H57_21400 [Paenibacillus pabuli]|nr:hypothetical protein [Paenibacillus pabuli]MEC0127153.1 hypothetical protein [Paenibacillus pabuli]
MHKTNTKQKNKLGILYGIRLVLYIAGRGVRFNLTTLFDKTGVYPIGMVTIYTISTICYVMF